MANVQMEYYTGSSYTLLYPVVKLSNNDGTSLSASYISGTLSTSNLPSGLPNIANGTYTGTDTKSFNITVNHKSKLLIIGTSNGGVLVFPFGSVSSSTKVYSTASVPALINSQYGFYMECLYGQSYSTYAKITKSTSIMSNGGSISNITDSAIYLMNSNNVTYYWIAIY